MASSNYARVKARRCAVQALYQWHLSGAEPAAIVAEFLSDREVESVDVEYFSALTREIPRLEPELRTELATAIDRPWERIGPVERSVLLLGVYEAIELCKMFGADEAHRYVNGVIDKLARRIRKLEVEGAAGR
mgnify:CR=1 FL=1